MKKQAMTQEQRDTRKKLFALYEASKKDAVEAKKLVYEAERQASNALQKILEDFGSGPYRIGETEFIVAKMRGPNEGFYLREKSKKEVEEM